MDFNDVYGGNWLRAPDLKGRDVTLTISQVSETTFKEKDGTQKKQVVLHFAGTEKCLGLNITNGRVVKNLYGGERIDEAWVGKRITVYPTETEAFGEIVDCIRIRREAPANDNSPPAATPPVQQHQPIDEDDIPF